MTAAAVTERVRLAHGDGWQAEGRLRAGLGGGALVLPGLRLMADDQGQPQWSSGDVHDVDVAADQLDAARWWYADRGARWGVRVPQGARWPHGRLLTTRRLMWCEPGCWVEPPSVDGVRLRRAAAADPADPADLEKVTWVDVASFGDQPAVARRWLAPQLADPDHSVVLAEDAEGSPLGAATALVSRGLAGLTVGVSAVSVLPAHRGRGIAAALTAYAVQGGLDRGARFLHLSPDDDRAARVYSRLGFTEVPGLDVYVDV